MKMMLALLVLVLIQIPFAQAASSGPSCLPYSGSRINRDPGDAWPWGSERPFPWRGIQGTWQTNLNGCTALFTFRVTKSVSGVNQLQVIQYDPVSCKVMSRGIGFEDTRVVRAVMTNIHQETFDLTVHVFNKTDINAGGMLAFSTKTVTVMNMSPLGVSDERFSYQLEKLSTDPKGVCH